MQVMEKLMVQTQLQRRNILNNWYDQSSVHGRLVRRESFKSIYVCVPMARQGVWRSHLSRLKTIIPLKERLGHTSGRLWSRCDPSPATQNSMRSCAACAMS